MKSKVRNQFVQLIIIREERISLTDREDLGVA